MLVVGAVSAASVVSCADNKEVLPPKSTKHSIVLTVGDGGESAVATVGAGSQIQTVTEADAGTMVRITAVATEGYYFKEWTVADTSTPVTPGSATAFQTSFEMPNGPVAITAVFEAGSGEMRDLYFSNKVIRGTMTATVDGVKTSSADVESLKVMAGKTVTIEVVDVDPGYEFGYWHIEDPDSDPQSPSYWDELFTGDRKNENPSSFVMPFNEVGATLNVILHEKGYTVRSSVNDADMGEVRIVTYSGGSEHNNTTDGQTEWPVYKGRDVKITAEAKSGYRLKEWTDAQGFTLPADKTTNPLEFKMPGNDVGVKAVFEAIPVVYSKIVFEQISNCTVSVTTDDGPVTSNVTNVRAGMTVYVKAEPVEYYSFVKWTGADFAAATSSETTFTMPTTDVTLTATVEKTKYALSVVAETGAAASATVDGQPHTSGGTVEWGKTVTVTANITGGADFMFTEWEGDGVTFTGSDQLTATFEMPKAATSITARVQNNPPVKHAYVEIAGLDWATVDVGEPGQFADNTTNAQNIANIGCYYQWASNAGFHVQDTGSSASRKVLTPYPSSATFISKTNYNADPTYMEATSWSSLTDPCPKGWRVPTEAEWTALMNACDQPEVPSGTNPVILNKTGGGAALSFPEGGEIYWTSNAATWRSAGPGRYTHAYWSSTKASRESARSVSFDVNAISLGWGPLYNIYSSDAYIALRIRCVSKDPTKTRP